jgi:diguanylate cyclase (GGDEF)-like protein
MRLLQLEHHDHRVYEYHEQALLTTGVWQGELHGRSKNGETFTCLMTVNAVRNEQGEPTRFVHLSTDISRLKEIEAQLRQLALFDSLTGLANRDLLHDRLQQALYESARDRSLAALILLDLDDFKDINNTLGHPSGDRVLTEVGERLRECTRQGDTVARMGGDEFIIVLRNAADTESLCPVAQRILESLARPFHLDDRRVFLTVSLGIALYPLDGRDTDELIRKADTAMYHAKGKGKNRFQFYTAEMNLRAQERLTLQTDLRRALEKKEFIVHYQPKINIETSEVTGVEALVRWQKPNDGIVPPASFIPLAEETGLIVPIGESVLRLACAQIKSWQAQGVANLPVAVNLSAIQLREAGLAATMRRILTECELEPDALELEITESAIMQEGEQASTTLQALRVMGIRITMDDFGTGYSSLSYLKRFPISCLKIDRTFIADVMSDSDDAEIIRAIIAMAHRLRLKVVAEGVETAEQLAFLRQEGCDEAQGYYFARPLPADEFLRWFQTRSATDPA